MKADLEVAALVLPYNKMQPIRVFRNAKGSTPFIRVRKHEKTNTWFSYVNPNGPVLVDPDPTDRVGVVVFVPRVLQPGEGILIEKILSSGKSAKGSPVTLPQDWVCPMEIEFVSLM